MSGLAEFLLTNGYTVTGSDVMDSILYRICAIRELR